MEIIIPNEVEEIIKTLSEAGYEAYIVGGCVRDMFLNKKPKDWDVTTSAEPEEVKKLFKHTIDTGIEHGTVTIMIDKTGYEVTTYRIDGKYIDGRHPESVTFTPSLEEDLKRRDFTINALAYNKEKGIVDLFEGVNDLNNGIIRCVGSAKMRFSEDALRILRAIRFAAQLGFKIEEDTIDAIKLIGASLYIISRERIQTELDKILISQNPDKIILVQEYGLFEVIFDTEKNMPDCTSELKIKALKAIRDDHYLRWAVFLSDLDEASVKAILKSLKFDNKTIKTVSMLVKNYGKKIEEDEAAVRKALHILGDEVFNLLLEMLPEMSQDKKSAIVHKKNIMLLYNRIKERGDCISLKELTINGSDLIQMGVEPGKKVGEILSHLLDEVICDPRLNSKEKLIVYVKELIK